MRRHDVINSYFQLQRRSRSIHSLHSFPMLRVHLLVGSNSECSRRASQAILDWLTLSFFFRSSRAMSALSCKISGAVVRNMYNSATRCCIWNNDASHARAIAGSATKTEIGFGFPAGPPLQLSLSTTYFSVTIIANASVGSHIIPECDRYIGQEFHSIAQR